MYLQVDTKKKCNNWFSRGAQMLSSGCNPLLTIARNGEQYYKRSGVSRQWEITYFGRAKINKGVIVPGYVVPSHGKYRNHFNVNYTFTSRKITIPKNYLYFMYYNLITRGSA